MLVTTGIIAQLLLAAQLELTLENRTSTDKTVIVTINGSKSRFRTESVDVGANSSTFIRLKNLRKDDRYRLNVDDSRSNPSVGGGHISKTTGSHQVSFQIPEVAYPEDATDHLATLIDDLNVGDKLYDDVVPMIDLWAQLGSVIVASRADDGHLEFHTHIALENVELPARTPQRIRDNIVTSRDAMIAFAFRPLLLGIDLRMNASSIYSMSYAIDKSNYLNPFEVQDALMHASPAKLEQILIAVAGIEDATATLYAVHSFTCIENAVFTLSEGESIVAGANVTFGTVLTAGGRYSFAHQRETFIDAQDICLSIVPAKIADRSFILAYLRSRLYGIGDLKTLGTPSVLDDSADDFTKSLRRHRPTGRDDFEDL